MNRPFLNFSGPIVPKNSRQIESLVEGSDERVISDLIPTAAVTLTFPAVGDLLSSIDWTNQPTNDVFAGFIFQSMTREDGWFTRLHYARDYTGINPETNSAWEATPIQSEEGFEDFPWHSVLKGMEILPDFTVMRSSRDVNGNIQLHPTYHVYPAVVEGGNIGTKILKELYVRNTPFSVPDLITPTTRSIVVPLPGGDVWTFNRCLCEEIDVEAILTNAGAVTSLGTPASAFSGALPGIKILATNPPRWRTRIFSMSPVSLKGGLYGMEVKTAFAPKEPTVNILTS